MRGYAQLGLDGGVTRYAKASTVVRLAGDELEVLREGVLDAGTIERMRMVTIVMVCTGNSCRSPMAEAFFAELLAGRLGCRIDDLGPRGYKIESAGTSTAPGMPAASESVAICGERGLDISRHQAQLVTESLLGRADVVFVMEESHRRLLEAMGARSGQVMLLCEEGAVADPIGQGIGAYRRCAAQIDRCVRARLEELW
jgi:protein-tyrosine phosphatase